MFRTINVRVDFPVYFQIEIDDEVPVNELQDEIKNHADYLLETTAIEPIIISSPDMPELV